MEVAIGDKSAKKFSKISYPFGSTWCRNALWNSLTLLNEHTIAAVASATTDSICAPWIINGYIITDLKALKRSIGLTAFTIRMNGEENILSSSDIRV